MFCLLSFFLQLLLDALLKLVTHYHSTQCLRKNTDEINMTTFGPYQLILFNWSFYIEFLFKSSSNDYVAC